MTGSIAQVADVPLTGPDDLWTVALYAAARPETAIGSGVLVDRRRVLTCWHVIEQQHSPLAPLTVAFPKAGVSRAVRRVVGGIRGNPADDVAVLELAEPAPPEAQPAPLRSPEPGALRGGRWWAFGFPRDSPLGSEANGVFAGPLAYHCVGLERMSRFPVTAGFSGSGVWSEAYGAVVGLVHTARTGATDMAGDAQAITLYGIERVLPGERFQELTAWSVAAAGDTALGVWGWSLRRDAEAVRHWYPRARGVSIDTENGYRFRGRTKALSRIVTWLSRSRSVPRVLVVTGSPGVGKSAVLGRIVTTADREIQAALPGDDRNVRAPLGSIACAVHAKGKTDREVAVEIAQAASVRIPGRVQELAVALRQRLGLDHGQRPFNLVIDALDEAASPVHARGIVKGLLLPIIQQCSSLGARVVVGSRRVDDGGPLLRAFGRSAVLIDLDDLEYFTLADLTDYAQATLALLGDERPGNPYADPAVAEPVARRIATLAEPNFLIAGLIARSHGMYDTQAIGPEQLSFTATVDEALAEYLERLPPVGGVPATKVLAALAYAEAPGLSLDLWQAALDALEVPVSPDTLAAFAGSSAANFLVETSNDAGKRRYRLFHQALNDALRRGHGDERALAAELIRHGRDGAGGWARADPYLLRSLPAFAARAGMIDALLLDDGFLLHADLPRLASLAGQAGTAEGAARARLLRLTPQAIRARPAERAAMFGVTAEIESLRNTFAAMRGLPYRIRWASATRRAEHGALEGYPGAVRAVCVVTVDGRQHLATVGDFPFLRLWDPASGLHRDLPLSARRLLAVCVVRVDTGDLLAAAGRGGKVFFVDPEGMTPTTSFACLGTPVRALAALTVDNEEHLAAGCADGMIRMWRVADLRPRTFLAHRGPIRAMSVIRRGPSPLIATGGEDHTARIWNPATGQRLRNYADNIDVIRSVCAIAIDGRELLAASNFNEVKLWNRGKGPLAYGSLTGHTGAVRAVTAVEVEGRSLLAAAAAGGEVRVWDLAEWQGELLLTGHTGAVTAACTVTIDRRELLATVSQDRTARLWDLSAADVERRGRNRISAACAVRVGARHLVAVADHRSPIRLLDVETGAEADEVGQISGELTGLCTVADKDRELIVTATTGGLLQTWDPARSRQLFARGRTFESVHAICPVTDKGDQVLLAAAVNSPTALRLFRPGTGRALARHRMGGLLSNEETLRHLRAMRLMHQVTDDLLATAGDDLKVLLWRTNGRKVTVLNGHRADVRALATVPAEPQPLIATGSDDQTIRLWDPAGRCLTMLSGHADSVTTLCPVTIDDQLMLASGSKDRTVRVWDLADHTAVLTIPVHAPVATCLEISGLLFVGLASGSLALDLNARQNEPAHFQKI